MIFSFIIVFAIIAALITGYIRKRSRISSYRLPQNTRALLTENVPFYNTLTPQEQGVFEDRIKDFLANTTIRGVDTEVEDLDKLLIASGAIILIFSFPDWKYNNISEILLYNSTFNKDYSTEAKDRNVLGLVGDGAIHGEMILSKPSLRASFKNATDGHNTVMHEFAHLIDMADGIADGVPEYLLTRTAVTPWIKMVHQQINKIRSGHSDINLYGATNDAEFFAVLTECFFEKPDMLHKKHPELYAMLEQMFKPATKAA